MKIMKHWAGGFILSDTIVINRKRLTFEKVYDISSDAVFAMNDFEECFKVAKNNQYKLKECIA